MYTPKTYVIKNPHPDRFGLEGETLRVGKKSGFVAFLFTVAVVNSPAPLDEHIVDRSKCFFEFLRV